MKGPIHSPQATKPGLLALSRLLSSERTGLQQPCWEKKKKTPSFLANSWHYLIGAPPTHPRSCSCPMPCSVSSWAGARPEAAAGPYRKGCKFSPVPSSPAASEGLPGRCRHTAAPAARGKMDEVGVLNSARSRPLLPSPNSPEPGNSQRREGKTEPTCCRWPLVRPCHSSEISHFYFSCRVPHDGQVLQQTEARRAPSLCWSLGPGPPPAAVRGSITARAHPAQFCPISQGFLAHLPVTASSSHWRSCTGSR